MIPVSNGLMISKSCINRRSPNSHPEAPTRVATLLKRQKGKCAHCGLFFLNSDLMEIDHQIPRSKDGSDCYDNLQLLHGDCHDPKTAADNVAVRVPQIDEDYLNLNPF